MLKIEEKEKIIIPFLNKLLKETQEKKVTWEYTQEGHCCFLDMGEKQKDKISFIYNKEDEEIEDEYGEKKEILPNSYILTFKNMFDVDYEIFYSCIPEEEVFKLFEQLYLLILDLDKEKEENFIKKCNFYINK